MSRPIADRVYGCRECWKPIALVGDALPDDGLCPWCRGSASSDAPGVAALYRKDKEAES